MFNNNPNFYPEGNEIINQEVINTRERIIGNVGIIRDIIDANRTNEDTNLNHQLHQFINNLENDVENEENRETL